MSPSFGPTTAVVTGASRGIGRAVALELARFSRYHAEGSLITPEQSARSLVALLRTAATGRIWTVSDHAPEDPDEE